MARPAGPALEQLRPPRPEQEQRPHRLRHERVEKLKQLLIGPVQILDKHDRGTLTNELADKLRPGVV